MTKEAGIYTLIFFIFYFYFHINKINWAFLFNEHDFKIVSTSYPINSSIMTRIIAKLVLTDNVDNLDKKKSKFNDKYMNYKFLLHAMKVRHRPYSQCYYLLPTTTQRHDTN